MTPKDCSVCGKPTNQHGGAFMCCPFCGSNTILLLSGEAGRKIISCHGCPAEMSALAPDYVGLKHIWNMRAVESKDWS
jgi:hypothetical protein